MDIKAINIAIQNANKVTVALADQGLFAEAGVIHSLTQAIRVVHNEHSNLTTRNAELRCQIDALAAELDKLRDWAASTNPYPPELSMESSSKSMTPDQCEHSDDRGNPEHE